MIAYLYFPRLPGGPPFGYALNDDWSRPSFVLLNEFLNRDVVNMDALNIVGESVGPEHLVLFLVVAVLAPLRKENLCPVLRLVVVH